MFFVVVVFGRGGGGGGGAGEWLNSERKVPFAKGRFLSRKEGFFYERKISVGPREIFYVSSDTFETS